MSSKYLLRPPRPRYSGLLSGGILAVYFFVRYLKEEMKKIIDKSI